MALIKSPRAAIFPIVAEQEVGLRDRKFVFLGTGFFVDPDGTFLTAKHVFTGHGLDRSSEFRAAMISPDGDVELFKVADIRRDEQYDIALARAIDVGGHEPLQLAAEEAALNDDVLTLEYSGTSSRQMPGGQVGLVFLSYGRKGHILCRRLSDFPGPKQAWVLELSFPALRGSSGAPVILERTGAVIGMLLANVEHHLLPAHVERIESEPGITEERKYFLPTGLAIYWSHLREFVESVRPA